jgi:ABC-type oligopeptide transport system substrate-binding subunit
METPDPPQTGFLAEPARAFRIERWEPGRRAVWAADDNAAGGRPFLDGIEINLARPLREQALDLELGKADLVEVGPNEARRQRRTWASAPVRLVALVFDPRIADVGVRAALALAIDRGAIHSVLLQRQGETAGALLPQWLSGYAFLFPAAQNLPLARSLAAPLAAGTKSLSLTYDAAEPLARSIAERIAVNARDAGLLVAVSPQNRYADVRLVEVRIDAAEPARALARVAAALGLGEPAKGAGPEALYAAERALLEGYRVVPLFHLPEVYGAGPRVRTWLEPAIGELGEWRLENLWLERTGP